MEEKTEIQVSEHVYFDTSNGLFRLTSEAQEIIYREKRIICSYSGSNEWINNFMLELLDLYTGGSPYNYSINSVCHKDVLPKIFGVNKQAVIDFIEKSKTEEWGIAMYSAIDMIINNLPTN